MIVQGKAATQRNVLYQIATAIEDHQLLIGASLIASSVGLWCLRSEPERQVYTLTLQPTEAEPSQKHIDFTKEQFHSAKSVEPSHFIEMSNGDVLAFRPTHYPLTVENSIAGVPLGEATIPVEVVEISVNGEKQGYFDFHQDKFIPSNIMTVEQELVAALRDIR